MRSVALLAVLATICVVLGWTIAPAEPRTLEKPDHPWRRTADGWVKATWLPKQGPELDLQTEPSSPPINVPHPLYLVAIQVLAIAYATVAEWPDSRREKSAAKTLA